MSEIEAPAGAAPPARELDAAQILADGADRGADAHLVVVEQDEHARLAVTDVIERFEREPAHEGRVAHHHGDALVTAASIPGQRQPFGDGDAGAGVPAIHDVVLALAPAREATDATQLTECPEAFEPAGEQLVGVGLVAGVPDDAVSRAGHDAVECHGQLDHTQRAAQVTTGGGDGVDDLATDLGAQGSRLSVADVAEIVRTVKVAQRHHD